MYYDNAYDRPRDYRLRVAYRNACDAVWLGYPRYTVDWGDLDRKEVETIWKQAKASVLTD